MTRVDFQRLAKDRLSDATALLRLRRYGAAYYLAGYAVECAFKACIAKRTKRYDFPTRQRDRKNPYTHEFGTLAELAGLGESIRGNDQREFKRNWKVVTEWSPESRYTKIERIRALDMVAAVGDEEGGILAWLKQRW